MMSNKNDELLKKNLYGLSPAKKSIRTDTEIELQFLTYQASFFQRFTRRHQAHQIYFLTLSFPPLRMPRREAPLLVRKAANLLAHAYFAALHSLPSKNSASM